MHTLTKLHTIKSIELQYKINLLKPTVSIYKMLSIIQLYTK